MYIYFLTGTIFCFAVDRRNLRTQGSYSVIYNTALYQECYIESPVYQCSQGILHDLGTSGFLLMFGLYVECRLVSVCVRLLCAALICSNIVSPKLKISYLGLTLTWLVSIQSIFLQQRLDLGYLESCRADSLSKQHVGKFRHYWRKDF